MDRRLTIALGLFIAGCGATSCGGKAPGTACASAGECREGHVCVAGADMAHVCMLPCEAGMFFCEDGSLCLDRGADGHLCWFGGRTPYRMPCTETPECEPGTLCVTGATQSTCEQGCNPASDLICRDGIETCVALETGGWCQPVPMLDGAIDGPGDGATTP